MTSTSGDGKILYREGTTIGEGRKKLNNVWVINLGAIYMTSWRE